MPAPASGSAAEEKHLLEEFTTYDQHVDVVSALEWLFTWGKGIQDTVVRFERFPRIKVEGKTYTPDFTVLFTDGTAIVGEIAKMELHDNSVDKLCSQIGHYADFDHVPDARGRLVPVQHVDVVLLVDMDIGLAAVRRIIRERFASLDHPYSPAESPCIVQFVRRESHYSFQRLQGPDNGVLHAGDRVPHIGGYLDEGLSIRAAHFVAIKSRRGFINDPIKPLYLATHLWTRTWRNAFGGGSTDITVEEQATATRFQGEYGIGGVTVVREALALLECAGLAASQGGGTWLVSRKSLGRTGDNELPKRSPGVRPRSAHPLWFSGHRVARRWRWTPSSSPCRRL
ncbi:hypothetical protein O2W18_21415 [Modestobacter sp. VKM Ac-2983]|uniref:hypothetical protein n=1 Tax=Modestobacter sp. VKM Ac-2983 TaxID=3004137 RepID=UPI0022AB9D78|nr:hypothetical protein [Modestobacter sp. VKM Ac-2983]MCZ2807674.1 hypothetical protein [Modestobacter sp. VKM Ac-2983]